MDIHFRLAELSDLKAIQDIYVDTILTVCRRDYESVQLKAWASSVKNKERWLQRFEEQHILVGLIGSKVVGFISLKSDELVDMIFVHKGYQRRGIAKQLLNRIEERAKSLNSYRLRAHVSITAQPFFLEQGFKIVKEQDHVIEGQSIRNALMTKSLS